MLAPPDQRFLARVAKVEGLPEEHVLHRIAGDHGVEAGRLVAVRLVGYEGTSLDVSALVALRSLCVTGDLRELTLGELPLLASLDVSESQVTSLDLTGLPALVQLNVSQSKLAILPRLPEGLRALACADLPLGAVSLRSASLSKLDVTRCGLAELDVSGLPALSSLECSFNRIGALDLRSLDRLEILWCTGNQAALTLPASAPLARLSIGKNRLDALDAGAFLQLELLFVDGMGLGELNLENPKLDHLDCSTNDLATLDLSRAPRIGTLEAKGNRLRELDLRPLHRLQGLSIDREVDIRCTELQKHTIPTLRARFGLPGPTRTIAKMDAYQLHAVANHHNWDDGEKRLFQVIRHPACTLATALLVYWKSEPQEFTAFASARDAPRGDRTIVELLREIEAGVEAGRYAKGPIPFDARDVGGVDLSDDDPGIPAVMRAAPS